MTLRRVADELGASAASLYDYVESKDVLVELMLDQVIGEIDLSDLPDSRPWQEQIKDLIRRTRDGLCRPRRHRARHPRPHPLRARTHSSRWR